MARQTSGRKAVRKMREKIWNIKNLSPIEGK
jgi:hypothetical protein